MRIKDKKMFVRGILLRGAGAVPAAEGVLGGGKDDPVGQGQGADLTGGEEFRSHGNVSFVKCHEALGTITVQLFHYIERCRKIQEKSTGRPAQVTYRSGMQKRYRQFSMPHKVKYRP